jgi:hypothetical protein
MLRGHIHPIHINSQVKELEIKQPKVSNRNAYQGLTCPDLSGINRNVFQRAHYDKYFIAEEI